MSERASGYAQYLYPRAGFIRGVPRGLVHGLSGVPVFARSVDLEEPRLLLSPPGQYPGARTGCALRVRTDGLQPRLRLPSQNGALPMAPLPGLRRPAQDDG